LDGATGGELWHQILVAPGGGDAFSVALRNGLDPIVVGQKTQSSCTDLEGQIGPCGLEADDFLVVKLNGTTGDVQWSREINGAGGDFDSGYAVAVDTAGSVVAAGLTTDTAGCFGSCPNFTVVKLNGTSGIDCGSSDRDFDGVSDACDNCPNVRNPD